MISEETYRCAICDSKSKFVLEWYGLNQYGKNPEVIFEVGICESFEHMVEFMNSYDNPHGELDGIVDIETFEVEYPQLADRVNRAYVGILRGSNFVVEEFMKSLEYCLQ